MFNTQSLGTWVWVIVIVVQVLGKCMSIGYLDPWGRRDFHCNAYWFTLWTSSSGISPPTFAVVGSSWQAKKK